MEDAYQLNCRIFFQLDDLDQFFTFEGNGLYNFFPVFIIFTPLLVSNCFQEPLLNFLDRLNVKNKSMYVSSKSIILQKGEIQRQTNFSSLILRIAADKMSRFFRIIYYLKQLSSLTFFAWSTYFLGLQLTAFFLFVSQPGQNTDINEICKPVVHHEMEIRFHTLIVNDEGTFLDLATI